MDKNILLLLGVQVTVIVYFLGRLFLTEIYGTDRASSPFSSRWVAPWNRAFYIAETERLFELYKEQLTEEELEILENDIFGDTELDSKPEEEEISLFWVKDSINYRF